MDLGITGRAALVTGASRGIGRGIAAALTAEGVRVAIASRGGEALAAAQEETGAEAGFAYDARVPGSGRELLAAAEAQLGPVEILVTNTGGPPAGAEFGQFSTEQWEDAYRSLVLAPLELADAALPGMRARGWGRIVNVGSSTVREPVPHLLLSNAHRVGTWAALKTLARQAAPDGVTINLLLPGRISTDRLVDLHGSAEAAAASARADVPAGRLGEVEEIAAVGAFLCSQQAGYVTGAAVPVDGGLLRGL